jgi:DNA-binding MarR family transcriptional regulator
MRITLVRQINGRELVEEFENTYGSLKRLENLYKRKPENMKLYSDLDDWKYFMEHPDEIIEDAKDIITEKLTLGKLELELLDFIKHNNPKSIRDLAKMMHKDISIVHPRVKKLEEEGLIEFKDGPKRRKIPVMNYDKIEIAV